MDESVSCRHGLLAVTLALAHILSRTLSQVTNRHYRNTGTKYNHCHNDIRPKVWLPAPADPSPSARKQTLWEPSLTLLGKPSLFPASDATDNRPHMAMQSIQRKRTAAVPARRAENDDYSWLTIVPHVLDRQYPDRSTLLTVSCCNVLRCFTLRCIALSMRVCLGCVFPRSAYA